MAILNKEKILDQAQSYVDEGKIDRAIREYEKIILADPTDVRVKLRMAELFGRLKRVADAIRCYREVAVHYATDGFFLKAVTVYKNVLRLNPSLIEINGELAGLYEKMGLVSDAVREYHIVATALERRGEVARVIEILTKVVALDPDDAVARTRLAEAYQRESKMEEALDQYEALALSLERKGGTEAKRIELYEKILSHRSDRVHMLRELIGIYYAMGEKRKALKWLESAKEVTPFDPALLGMQAEIYATLNQLESARTKYIALAELLCEQGEVDRALVAYGQILLVMPGEEERLLKKIEEVKPNAIDELQAWLVARRQEMADAVKHREEETKNQQAKEDHKVAEAARAKKEEHDQERQEKIHRLRGGTPAAASETKKAPVVATSARQDLTRVIDEVQSALDLAKAYRLMGLADEARGELERAQQLCAGVARDADPRLSVLIQEIDSLVSSPQSPPPKGKKKVSFV